MFKAEEVQGCVISQKSADLIYMTSEITYVVSAKPMSYIEKMSDVCYFDVREGLVQINHEHRDPTIVEIRLCGSVRNFRYGMLWACMVALAEVGSATVSFWWAYNFTHSQYYQKFN
jgi:hypothetical protein